MTSDPERRRHARAPANLLIQYRFDTFDELETEYIQDLSEGGVLIRTPSQVRPVGTTVHLQFMLRDGTRLIEGLARVVRAEDGASGFMALEFVDFDESSKEVIRRFVTEGHTNDLPTEDLLFGL